MKTVLLTRHAKSSWKENNLPDRERPLNKRGKKDAPLMGKLLYDKELVPQMILSSNAVRTSLTAEAVIEKTQFSGEVFYLDTLYLAEPEAYIKALHSLPDSAERVLVIGHNPGLEGLLQMFSRQVEALPTAAVAHIILPITSWGDITADTEGELVVLWRPQDFDGENTEKEKDKEKAKEKNKEKGKK